MGLFDQIIGAVTNPNQQGNLEQIGNIIGTVQQLSNNAGTDNSTMQSAIGIVGSYVRSALQEKRDNGGDEEVENVVNEFGNNSPSSDAVDSLFTPEMQQQVAQTVSERTGLDTGMVQQFLPTLVPMVLNLLKSGASNQGGNSVLSSFLDADGDGDVDITDAMQMASRYMGQ
ncbi:DUF937 domain-containing protein [Calothrix sp. 336/3]|uniref:DUF937 domain-containing protein n=1 Tax=Calothrix sp. 336/3 TaxID=1337936 RepID=UPI0004E30B16|nr:DUF937 domain-containing protein [Calothrix sp. 336/3]AKG23400.1 hypothetical protein IJ00_20880 [Calothrix sp. 336/3]